MNSISSSSTAGLSATEIADPRYKGLDTWPDEAILTALWQGQAAAVGCLQAALPAIADAAQAIAHRLKNDNGRLIYAGAGSSGLLAMQDGMEMTPTFAWPEERLVFLMAGGDDARLRPIGVVEDDTEGARRDADRVGFTPDDVLIAVAASGTTPYTLQILQAAADRKALTVAIANNAGTPLLSEARHAVHLDSGGEVIAGSTRMAAGTAQKAALGLLSTLVMTRLGHVVDGYMVSMVADNAKLRDRARRMVAAIADVPAETAEAALEDCGGNVKPAVLVARGMTPENAERALAEAGGDLRRTLSMTN